MDSDEIAGLSGEWRRFGVSRAWLFGSRAKKVNEVDSGWDFLVQFAHAPTFDTFMALKATLEKRLNGSVDILSRSACSPRLLNAIEKDLIDVT